MSRQSNLFYRDHYQKMMIVLMIVIALMVVVTSVLLYQIFHRPLPLFFADAAGKQRMTLVSYDEPNLSSSALLKWASKATVAAYTFDFVSYTKQIAAARPYFTDAGWSDYLRSINPLIQTITQNQLFVNSVVSGTPVIANQGELEGRGYVWRVQMPFLVTYQSAEALQKQTYTVVLTITRVPTWKNPAAIGIDQFVMI
jgi:intracellular multiplication protein IcmL